jgi:hypothetical protein
MKPRLTLLVVLSLAAFALAHAQSAHKRAPGPTVNSPQEIAENIQRLEGELRVAIMKGDSAWFEEHLAENYTETDPNGKVSSRAEVIQFYKTVQPEYDSWNLSDGTARTYNGNTVILTGKTELEGAVRGQHVSGAFRFTRVWIKKGLEWQLAASQATRIAS